MAQESNRKPIRSLFSRLGIVLIILMGSLAVCPVHAADLSAAKALAKSKGCFQCHGSSGNTGSGGDSPVPKLAGQSKEYLMKTMNDYRSGIRQDKNMNILMVPRTDEEIETLAEYYAAQKRY